MGDRSPITVIIHDCPPDKVADVHEALDDYDIPYGDEVETGAPIFDSEQGLDVPDQLISALADLGCTATVQQDAKYEWDAVLHRYAPGLGHHEVNCTQEGEPYITEATLTKLRELADIDYEGMVVVRPFLDAIDVHLGRAHGAFIEHLEAQRATPEK